MLLLYTEDNSTACKQVRDAFDYHLVVYEERNIGEPSVKEELQARGLTEVPVLVDTTANTVIKDPEEMIAYGTEYSF